MKAPHRLKSIRASSSATIAQIAIARPRCQAPFAQLLAKPVHIAVSATKYRASFRSFSCSRPSRTSRDDADVSSYTSSPDAFPWQFPESPPRTVGHPPTDPGWFQRNIVFPVVGVFTKIYCENFARGTFGAQYLENQFVVGAAQALTALGPAITQPNRDFMERACTPALSSALQSSLDRLARRTSADGTEEIEDTFSLAIHRVHDVRISEVWVTFGSSSPAVTEDGAGLTAAPKYRLRDRFRGFTVLEDSKSDTFLVRFMTLAWLLPSRTWLSGNKSSLEVVTESAARGAVVTVDAEVDAEWEVSHVQRSRTKHAKSDSGSFAEPSGDRDWESERVLVHSRHRYPIILSLTTQHFIPPSAAASQTASPLSPPAALVEPEWKLADIDGLVASRVWEAQVESGRKAKAQREEGEDSEV